MKRAVLAALVIVAGFLCAAALNDQYHIWSIAQSRLTGMIVPTAPVGSVAPAAPAARPAPASHGAVPTLVLNQLNLQARDIPGDAAPTDGSPWTPFTPTAAWLRGWQVRSWSVHTYCADRATICYASFAVGFGSVALARAYFQTTTQSYAGSGATVLPVPTLGDATSAWTQPGTLYDTPGLKNAIFVQQGEYFFALTILGADAGPDALYHTAGVVARRLATFG